jgi:hypothetical protein
VSSIHREIARLHRALAELHEQLGEEQSAPVKRVRARHEPDLPPPTQLDEARAGRALRELETRRRLRRS